ncbi:MAG: hypothetical protein WD772_04980, partial [Pseudohongiellaceae bacterium]
MFRFLLLQLALGLAVFPVPGQSQVDLLDDRWLTLESENFVMFSQVSASRTEQFAMELETWRQAAARVI